MKELSHILIPISMGFVFATLYLSGNALWRLYKAPPESAFAQRKSTGKNLAMLMCSYIAYVVIFYFFADTNLTVSKKTILALFVLCYIPLRLTAMLSRRKKAKVALATFALFIVGLFATLYASF